MKKIDHGGIRTNGPITGSVVRRGVTSLIFPIFLLFMVLSITVGIPGAASAEWSSFRSDETNLGYSDLAVTETLNISWIKDLSGGWIDPSPAVVNGRIYVHTNGEYDFFTQKQISPSSLICLKERTGEIIWSVKVSDSKVQLSSPAVYGGLVAVGSSDGTLYAFNATSGASRFTFETENSPFGITSSPLFVRDRLVFGGGDGNLYCVDMQGKKIWSRDTGNTVYFTSPAYKDGNLFIGNDGGNLSCINASDGSLLWAHHVDGRIRTTPLIVGEKIIFSWASYSGNIVTDGWLRAVDMNGTLAWENHIGGTISSPASDGNLLFVANNEGWLKCYSLDGEMKWEYRANGPIQSSPAVAMNGVVFLSNINLSGNHSTLYFLDKTGNKYFSYKITPHQWALSSPVIGRGSIIFASDNGYIYCVSDGKFDKTDDKMEIEHGEDESDGRDMKEAPGRWLLLTVMIIVPLAGLSLIGRKKERASEGGPKALTKGSLADTIGKRMDVSRRKTILKICVFFAVLVVISCAVAVSLQIPGVGSRGSPRFGSGLTLKIVFGREDAPINPGNETLWTFRENQWLMETGPSNSSVWTFTNISSDKGTVLDCLVNAMDVAGTDVETSEYIYGTFIRSIAGVENGRNDRNWLYWVNGEFANMASDVYYLEDGDEVLWKYTNEFQ
ncbi:MAG: PQQ-binding-like beta-propeller repeat protein [Candidatus Thermoplasmatota archaeon]|nr:PQQ-binding-like beta-propeller repeat protein [Candidatus Thermoplasmatota archaeon]MDP7264539.1 PQQ-binding-like beta-propeller repeat protein [Candidatus Thermoplasmatota archaeon]